MGMRCIRLLHSYKVAVEFLVTLFLLLLRFDGCQASSSSSPTTTTHRCVEEERRALLQLRDSFNFPNGHALSYWVGDDCCKWKGVECDLFSSTSRVISIDISYERQSEQGTWYPNATLFTEFKQLQTLDLSGNKISGWINVQALCQLHNLKELWVGGNNLGDDGLPWCLGRSLPFLEEVSLWGNNRGPSGIF
ncbi:PREDICTED: receptor-like protein 12 [Nelumbo nucifera]|uniref:Receptor-like protein 12 n=1 Tax=Nelumbo nucifera TaxID=4432 RepID=A0A1U8AE69_NELNU|nr:PREDICTED: receptor-like protein 12 [Nelumbo nucifera]